jgi:hypothetical protein
MGKIRTTVYTVHPLRRARLCQEQSQGMEVPEAGETFVTRCTA